MDILEMSLKYSAYVTEEYVRQAEYNRYLEECVLTGINENTREQIDVINEGFIDSIKNGLKKLWNAIVKMWHKFLEGMNTLFRNNKSYLEKYKDIILKKKFPEGTTISMHNYPEGIKRLVEAEIPDFKYNGKDIKALFQGLDKTLLEKLKEEDIQLTLKKELFSKYYNNNYENNDEVKTYLRGGTKEEQVYDANKINMTDIYNYCYSADDLIKKIETSIKNLENDVTQVITYIDNKAAATVKKESGYYSNIYGTYVTEANPVNVPKGNEGGDSNASSTGSGTTNNAPTNNPAVANKDGERVDVGAEKKAIDDNIGDDHELLNYLSKAYRAYLSVAGGFLGTKLTIAKEIYGVYMQIIKSLVRLTVGDKDADSKAVKDKGTEYNKDGKGNEAKEEKKEEEVEM